MLTINFIIFWYKTVRANCILANATAKTTVVPLFVSVFHLFRT